MSCLTVNTQVTRNVCNPVIKIESSASSNVDSKKDDSTSASSSYPVHYPDLNDDNSVNNLILQFILNDLEDKNGIILLSIDEMKKVLKVLCHCDDVIIEAVPPTDDEVSCCGITKEIVYEAVVKKILLKYNDRACLEDFKMHYNELKILTESYKVDIEHVKNSISK